MSKQRFNIDNIAISATNLSDALSQIDEAIANNKTGYICVTNSRTTYLANHDKEYCQIQNNSLLTVPDGAPLVWIAHLKGFKEVTKVSGKDLMHSVFSNYQNSYSHFFFGGKPQTEKKLKYALLHLYPKLKIKTIVSPPIQPLEEFNIEALAQQINVLNPTFFWCGLGAPKQEKLIALLQPKLNNTICVGVGAAFDYYGGTLKRAPSFMRNLGLEWIYRVFQNPRKAKRFIIPFFSMLFRLINESLRKLI
ncbi:MAG: WecB/TagA/CpsF family glycosyltransferase [bacterium]